MSLRAVIVGCGKIADAHVEELKKIPSAQLVAVCDLEPIMAEQLAVRFSIPRWYSDIAKLLETEKPDVVHITTPPQSHLALTRQAVAAGAHVFLEKPVALHHAEAVEIVKAVEDAGRKLSVNYWPRFDAAALELKDLYEAGTLGEAVHIESSYGYDLAGDFGTALRRDPNHWVRQMPGKLFQNILDHVVNRITPFLPDEEPEIHAIAYCGDRNANLADPNTILDELRVILRGQHTSAYATFSANARPNAQTLRVYGTRNTAFVDFGARTVVLERKQSFPSALGRLFPSFQVSRDYWRQGRKNLRAFRRARFHFFDGMRTLLTDFYASIENNTAPPLDYGEILRVSSIMERIFEQVYPEARP